MAKELTLYGDGIWRGSDGSTVAAYVPPPIVIPDPPTIGTASATESTAVVSFNAPAFTGNAVIDHYKITSSPDGITAITGGSPVTVPGLTNGTSYTFTVQAHNSAGYSNPSGVSNVCTPQVRVTPTRTNRGVPSGTVLTDWTGSNTFRVANQVIEDKIFRSVFVDANNVVFRRCLFQANVDYNTTLFLVNYNNPNAFAVFEDCEFDGASRNTLSGGGQGVVAFGQFYLLRCYVHHGADCIRVGTSSIVEDCWVGDTIKIYDTQHCDAIQSAGATNPNGNNLLRIKNCTIVGTTISGGTGDWGMPIILKADTGPIQGTVEIIGNRIEGGILGLQLRSGSAGATSYTASTLIKDNVFVKGSFTFNANPVDIQTAGTVTSINNLYDDSTPVPGL